MTGQQRAKQEKQRNRRYEDLDHRRNANSTV